MEGFEWGENNLGVGSPDELQAKGVDVSFAPNIPVDAWVVDLDGGRVERFLDAAARPDSGSYADYASLARYCAERGTPMVETNGQASVMPAEA